ncbi:MAG: RluA family pseudouridine synthase [Bacteroidia bacterium]
MLSIEKRILYEDNHLIAVNKLPGELSQGDHTGDVPLGELIKAFLKEKYKKPGNVYCGVPHRLDRPVSGVMLFAKTDKALIRLTAAFRTREMEKTYWALVSHKPEQFSAELVHWLLKDPEKNKTKAFTIEKQGSVKAVLEYKLVMHQKNYYLLEVKPHTGRPHQIRVQLASISCPIVGDVKYGHAGKSTGSIYLHARSIRFIHPVKKEPLEIVAPLPSDPVWNQFR